MLKFICDYRALIGRRNLFRRSFTPADMERLAALEQVLATAPIDESEEPSTRRRYIRRDVTFIATLEVGQRATSCTIANISGGGAFIRQPVPALRQGDTTMITVVDGARRSFLFPAKVVWSSNERGLGLTFIGIPKEVSASGTGSHRAIG
jgi:hypothetical protein